MRDDAQLLGAYAHGGDVPSLSELVVRHERWLLAYLRGLVPNAADAEDAFQETWMRVIRSCGSYRGGSVRAYLVRIARSVVIDRFRRAGAPAVSLDAADESGGSPADGLADSAPTPDVACVFRAAAEDVRTAVRALPARQREVLLMRIEGELAFREIAELLGVPQGTALTWMHQATLRLKRILGGEK